MLLSAKSSASCIRFSAELFFSITLHMSLTLGMQETISLRKFAFLSRTAKGSTASYFSQTWSSGDL